MWKTSVHEQCVWLVGIGREVRVGRGGGSLGVAHLVAVEDDIWHFVRIYSSIVVIGKVI